MREVRSCCQSGAVDADCRHEAVPGGWKRQSEGVAVMAELHWSAAEQRYAFNPRSVELHPA
jgi:hypothetical protein